MRTNSYFYAPMPHTNVVMSRHIAKLLYALGTASSFPHLRGYLLSL
jgi:hypothetical protein